MDDMPKTFPCTTTAAFCPGSWGIQQLGLCQSDAQRSRRRLRQWGTKNTKGSNVPPYWRGTVSTPCKLLWEPPGFSSLHCHYIGALTLITSWKRRKAEPKKERISLPVKFNRKILVFRQQDAHHN